MLPNQIPDAKLMPMLTATCQRFAELAADVVNAHFGKGLKPGPARPLQEGFVTEGQIAVSIMFTGTVFGEFVFSCDESVAADLLGMQVTGSSQREKLVQNTMDFLGEMLNVAAAQMLNELGRHFVKLTLTTPKSAHGRLHFGRVKAAHCPVRGAVGFLNCYFYLDQMRLDLADSYQTVVNHMVQTEKLAALGTMAGGVAHEINTPLAVLQMSQEEMCNLMKTAPADPRKIERLVGLLQTSINKIGRITEALRGYATDVQQEDYRSASLAAILEEAQILCHSHLHNGQIDFDFPDYPTDLTLECLPHPLSQVIANLLTNAAEAVATVDLTDKKIRLEVTEIGTWVELRVIDTGPGVSPEIRKRIFDPFFTTKEPGNGPGLGLSYARGIVIAHGGTLEIAEDWPPTIFIVRLPKFQTTKRRAA